MLDVLLCHSPADRDAACALAARLERCAEARVAREESGAVNELWEYGLSSAAVLLLLSPDAVPARAVREEWPMLDHTGPPHTGAVLLRDCAYPRLLERRPFWRWNGGRKETLRAIERWVVGLHHNQQPRFSPARLPWFEGREAELAQLWQWLVDDAGLAVALEGPAGAGKSCLAQQFACAASEHFRDVLWVDCEERSIAAIAGELRAQARASDESAIREHRVLIVLDGLDGPAPVSGGLCSVVITTRRADLEHVIRVDAGHRGSVPAADPLWQAMSVCRRNAVPLALAARIAGLDPAAAHEACERLVERRAVDPFDPARRRFRLAAPAAAPPEDLRRRHAEALQASFLHWRQNPGECAELLAEATAAFDWAARSDWPLAAALGQSVFAFLEAQGRLEEACETAEALLAAAAARADVRVVAECVWQLSWIRNQGGPLRPLPAVGDQLSLF